jgi:hypothetical protein
MCVIKKPPKRGPMFQVGNYRKMNELMKDKRCGAVISLVGKRLQIRGLLKLHKILALRALLYDKSWTLNVAKIGFEPQK